MKRGRLLDAGGRGLDRGAIELRAREDLAGDAHRLALDHRQLVALGDDLAPLVDLLVDVDLDRADAGAAAVQRRRERQRAVFAQVEVGSMITPIGPE
jgi:hypothetical protein